MLNVRRVVSNVLLEFMFLLLPQNVIPCCVFSCKIKFSFENIFKLGNTFFSLEFMPIHTNDLWELEHLEFHMRFEMNMCFICHPRLNLRGFTN